MPAGSRVDQRLQRPHAACGSPTRCGSGRPNGNATRTNFKLQGEYLRSTRSGSLVYDVDGRRPAPATYRAAQSGWYLQGVYQFMPRWRVGLRTERLDAGTPDYGVNAGRCRRQRLPARARTR